MFLLKLDPYNGKYILTSLNLFRINMPKYAVAIGRKIGVFDTWNECQSQIRGYPKAKYKKFDTQDEAEDFVKKFSKHETIQSVMIEDDLSPEFEKDIKDLLDCASDNSKNSSSGNKLVKTEKDIRDLLDCASDNSNNSSTGDKLVKTEKDDVDGWNYRPQNFQFPVPPFEHIMNKITSLEHKFVSFTSEINSKLDIIIDSFKTKRKASVDEEPRKKPKLEPTEQGDLIINENGSVVVYTDGACSSNGKAGAKAGIGVWFNHNHHLNVSAPVKGPPTNNTAEIQAARFAIKQAEKAMIEKLSIHTDSKFLISCITEWIHKWKKNNWTLTNGGPVKNKDELVKLDKAIKKLKVVEWNYVPGHKGVLGNEMADKLARAGAEEFRSNLTYGRDSQDFEE